MFIVYKLIYKDGTFYIGVSNNLKRRLGEHKRNKQTTGWERVEVLKEFNNIEDAYDLEKNLVPDHKDRDILLRNKTRGGRHPFNMRLGVSHTENTKLKISLSKKGKKLNLSEHTRQIKSERVKGDNNPAKREDVRKILSEKTKNNSKRKNQPGTMLGKNHKTETIEKISYKINTPYGVFDSSVKAAKSLMLSQQTVINRCRSNNFPEWWIISVGCKYNNV